MKYPATKIGNVIFYRVDEGTWLTHDGKYGVLRAYANKRRSECVVAHNKFKYATDPMIDDLAYYYLIANMGEESHIFSNARSAMQYICEYYYGESKN